MRKKNSRCRIHRRPSVCRVVGLSLLALILAPATASSRPHFSPVPIGVPQDHLFDLGVTDYDGDGRLDVFSTNHKFPSALLHNEQGRFVNRIGTTGLSPTPEFPGVEQLGRPHMRRPGIYLFMNSPPGRGDPSHVHIRTVGMPARGSLIFVSHRVGIARRSGAHAVRTKNANGFPVVGFVAGSDGAVDIKLQHIDLPIAVRFRNVGPGDVRVGSRATPASDGSFMITLRDRHGYAFADLGSSPETDLFVAAGGIGGAINSPRYRGGMDDELLISKGGRYDNEVKASGLTKGGCRGRQAAAVDFNGDGLLDVFEGCEGRSPRMFEQSQPGGFKLVQAPHEPSAAFRWADLRGDPTPELLAVSRAGTSVYRAGRSSPLQRLAYGRAGGVTRLAVGDLEDDGDLDVFAAGPRGNAVLLNRGSKLVRVPPQRFGLPRRSEAAAFVDYNNDGRLDLDLAPQGLMRRTAKRHFTPTGELLTPRGGSALLSWLDFDNDGLRDPLIAYGRSTFSPRKQVRLRRNLTSRSRHWLEVDLTGPPGNRQAIGARAHVSCGTQSEYGFVGESDTSLFSQGHYRLYFGLGGCRGPADVTVRWPDNSVDEFGPMPVDRVVSLTHAG